MYKINESMVARILEEMPENKKEVLGKALQRNMYLTSVAILNSCTLTVYIEGWYVELEGTRCRFAVFAKDNDGELEFIRKPAESKLHKLYKDWGPMDIDDFKNF